MNGGFKKLVNPATQVSSVDLRATREDRNQVHEEVHMRQYLEWLMANSAPGDGLVRVTPYEVISVEEDELGPTAA